MCNLLYALFLLFLFASSYVSRCEARVVGMGTRGQRLVVREDGNGTLQDIVTWDENSLFIRGERLMLFSAEFHPFRLPVPTLWLDVFQKIKAAGYNGVSFYVDWNLLEGKRGTFRAEGVFAWEPFFEAASKAGIYLLARPGPYINAEVSGGGFPGWLQTVNGTLRTRDPGFEHATDLYASEIGKRIAKAQITNGGPIILVQPENEYTTADGVSDFPQRDYFQYVIDQLRNAGVVVPTISNDAHPAGNLLPGSGEGAVDIYGHDSYPLGFDCANPTHWPDGNLPTTFRTLHEEQSPSTPYSLVEFQGGSFDPWGGSGFDKCTALLNEEFVRIFYKNNYGFGVTIFNNYMTFGGTNWGNLGHPGGYTSYDYGAFISEERSVHREKYSELKLETNFLHVSPAYLIAERGNLSTEWTTNDAISVTPAVGNGTRFYFLRHTQYNSLDSTQYKLHVQSQKLGNITVPQVAGSLSLNGRDSKVHVSDYKAGDSTLLYSTAEIFTWKKYADKTVLVVYGGPNENHEIAIETSSGDFSVLEGSGVNVTTKSDYLILSWNTSSERKIVGLAGEKLQIHILDRNSAYNYWVVGPADTFEVPSVIVKAGYLVRHATVSGSTLSLIGDINATTTVEVIGGGPSKLSKLTFNGEELDFSTNNKTGIAKANISFTMPDITLPDLSSLDWKYIDSLPEIQDSYSDSQWTSASLKKTPNTFRENTTPTSLYAGDYGYYTGTLLFRGHFTANGNETSFTVTTQGGSAYGASIWLGSTLLGSWVGIDAAENNSATYTIPSNLLTKGTEYVITVVMDNTGLEENWTVGEDQMKWPRGILDYTLAGHDPADVTWKLTGSLGGQDYRDLVRGPLNEGGLYAERQGYHLPSPPSGNWTTVRGGPLVGIDRAGVAFYTTHFDLDLPTGYDVSLSFVFANTTSNATTTEATAYRVQLFVNGWQYGKYTHNIGPQDRFPVPEGIWDYHGTNWVAISLWALEEGGAKLDGLALQVDGVVRTGYSGVEKSWNDQWVKREGAY